MKKMNLIMENWKRYLTEEEQSSNKKIFVLVGPPSVGKSHWINKTFGGPENVYIISRDDIVTSVAKKYGWTYDDMFTPPAKDAKLGDTDPKFGEVIKSPDYMTWQPLSLSKVLQANNEVQTLFTQRVSSASQSDKPIVVDMTNMNVGARKGALKAIEGKEKDYEKIAVIFKFQGAEQIIKRIAQKRAEEYKARGESKTIPPEALERMFKAYQQVTSEEGFDKIIDVDNTKELSKLVSSDNGPEQRVNEDKIKVNKNYLKQVIKEELQKVLKEGLDYEKITGMTLKKGYIEMGGDESEGTLEINVTYIGPDEETYEPINKEFSITLLEKQLKSFTEETLSKELGDQLNTYDQAITGGATDNVADLFSEFFKQKPDILKQILTVYR